MSQRHVGRAITQELLELQDGRCYYCGREILLKEAQLEHKTPPGYGGDSARTNLVASCARCNSLKGNLSEAEFVSYVILCGIDLHATGNKAQREEKEAEAWLVSHSLSS